MKLSNPKLAVIDNRFSNPRDLAANERNFLTSVRMICGLLTVTAALLLKFRFTTGGSDSLRLDSFGDATDTILSDPHNRLEADNLDLDNWAYILGYLPPTSGIAGSASTANVAETYSETGNPLLEQNHVAIPLGICVFAICAFILVSSTYGYNHTHRQLADGRAFAGSWRLEGSMTIILACLLLAASVSFLAVGRIES